VVLGILQARRDLKIGLWNIRALVGWDREGEERW